MLCLVIAAGVVGIVQLPSLSTPGHIILYSPVCLKQVSFFRSLFRKVPSGSEGFALSLRGCPIRPDLFWFACISTGHYLHNKFWLKEHKNSKI